VRASARTLPLAMSAEGDVQRFPGRGRACPVRSGELAGDWGMPVRLRDWLVRTWRTNLETQTLLRAQGHQAKGQGRRQRVFSVTSLWGEQSNCGQACTISTPLAGFCRSRIETSQCPGHLDDRFFRRALNAFGALAAFVEALRHERMTSISMCSSSLTGTSAEGHFGPLAGEDPRAAAPHGVWVSASSVPNRRSAILRVRRRSCLKPEQQPAPRSVRLAAKIRLSFFLPGHEASRRSARA